MSGDGCRGRVPPSTNGQGTPWAQNRRCSGSGFQFLSFALLSFFPSVFRPQIHNFLGKSS